MSTWWSPSTNEDQGDVYYLPLNGGGATSQHDMEASSSRMKGTKHHYHSSSSDSISSQNTITWTGDYSGQQHHQQYQHHSCSSITYTIWVVKKTLALISYSLVGVLAIYGLAMFVQIHVKQQYMPIPVYSTFEISQAGWQRRPYVASPYSYREGAATAAAAAAADPAATGDSSSTATTEHDDDHPSIHSAGNDVAHKGGLASGEESVSDSSPGTSTPQKTVLQMFDFDVDSTTTTTTTTRGTKGREEKAGGGSSVEEQPSQGYGNLDSESGHSLNTVKHEISTTTNTVHQSTTKKVINNKQLFSSPSSPVKAIRDLHILILTPLKNSEKDLSSYLSLLMGLDHPKENISLGFLIGDNDEKDATDEMIYDWILQQHARDEYRKITLLKKSFGVVMPGGEARHKNWLQAQRRSLMAKARTTLLTSTLEPSVDWVLWLDVDLVEAPKSLIADLLRYGGAGVEQDPDSFRNGLAALEDAKYQGHQSFGDEGENEDELDRPPVADVITPNIMKRRGPGRLQGYDLNNWSETPKSLKMKAKLLADRMLWEGNSGRPTYRKHLAHNWIRPNVSASWDDREDDFAYLNGVTIEDLHRRLYLDSSEPSDLFDPMSEAYIGQTEELDGVGGVATLVRAETHRFGAIFPSWLEDHEVETEGFGVLAKKAGARIVGLPNYLVMHQSNEYTVSQAQKTRKKLST